jgi:hypothetical protein
MKQKAIIAISTLILTSIIMNSTFATESESPPVVTKVILKEPPKQPEPETYPVAKTDAENDPEEMERLRKHAAKANIESANSNRVFGDIFAEVIKLILR